MADPKPRVKVPKIATAGEVIAIKCLISHEMETGFRKDADGKIIPREIINHFTCDFNGENVIDVAMNPSVSSNPYFEFEAKVDKSGEFTFKWTDDNGSVYEETQSIEVT